MLLRNKKVKEMGDFINKHKLGLVLGLFFAAIHAVWVLCVALMSGLMQRSLDWIVSLHFLKPFYVLTPFRAFSAVLLVVVAFIVGYVVGWLFAALWNVVKVKKVRESVSPRTKVRGLN